MSYKLLVLIRRMHSTTYHKSIIYVVTSVRTSNLMIILKFWDKIVLCSHKTCYCRVCFIQHICVKDFRKFRELHKFSSHMVHLQYLHSCVVKLRGFPTLNSFFLFSVPEGWKPKNSSEQHILYQLDVSTNSFISYSIKITIKSVACR